jgi:hypothetical protein
MAAAYTAHVFLVECFTLAQVFDGYLDHVISPVGSGLRSIADSRRQAGVCHEQNPAHINHGIFCASPDLFGIEDDKVLSSGQLLVGHSR